MLSLSLLTSLLLTGSVDLQLGNTFFQTNTFYNPQIALQTDFVVVHLHHDSRTEQAIKSWNEAGYPVGKMFFIGSDAGRKYTKGSWDGQTHLDETEMDRHGNPIECAGSRPYMIPTEGWRAFVREMTIQGVDAGAQVIMPEEPLAHTFGGYGEAFKRIWQERYGKPWSPPHDSVDAFYKSSRLLSDLYFELVRDSLQTTKKRASEIGRQVNFVLPVHSLLSYAAGSMVYPSGRTLVELKPEGLDGFVGQVWTGPIAWGMSRAEGLPMDRNEDFFESAYLLYSYFANLTWGTGLPCFMLADPVEDDPQYTWKEYRFWYNRCLTALLQFPWARHFEVMPWPDRVFLPGYEMAGGTPGPVHYRRALMIAFAMQQELSKLPTGEIWTEGGPMVGFLVADTLGWQMSGPQPASMTSVHGYTVPLLRDGIPIQIVPLERHADQALMERFRILVLSYDAMKPLSPEIHSSLSAYVKRGGILVFLGGEDPYNQVEDWWTREGYRAPDQHLWETLGVIAKGDPRQVVSGPFVISASSSIYSGTEPLVGKETDLLVYYPTRNATPLLTLNAGNVPVVSEMKVGEGWVLHCGLPSAWFADSIAGGNLARSITHYLANEKLHTPFPQNGDYYIERGAIVAVRPSRQARSLTGSYLDLFDPELPVLIDPIVQRRENAVLYRVDRMLNKWNGTRLLFSGPPAERLVDTPEHTCLYVKSPANTPATMRLACFKMTPAQVSVTNSRDKQVLPDNSIDKTHDPASDTLLLVFPADVKGATVSIDWK